jgi:hypothetical protein
MEEILIILMELVQDVHSSVKQDIHTIQKKIHVRNQDEIVEEEIMMKR